MHVQCYWYQHNIFFRTLAFKISFACVIFFQVTVASKFLTLQESVRDPADLYLSLKHYPLLFICDTPGGFVRHMDVREPETTKQLWGPFSGCLEQPIL